MIKTIYQFYIFISEFDNLLLFSVFLQEKKKLLINKKTKQLDFFIWGVELCKRIGSPNFKLLFDIYHMQIDEGDIIHSIQTNHQYYGHYHTGGVPGRNEIDEREKINGVSKGNI